jgi:bifunctional ADP-heptose synthase (sugar kinase/adenylyltransferase)
LTISKVRRPLASGQSRRILVLGDTAIAALFANHAAGVVAGKLGAAAVQPNELIETFRR